MNLKCIVLMLEHVKLNGKKFGLYTLKGGERIGYVDVQTLS